MSSVVGEYTAVEIRLLDMESGVYTDISPNERQKHTICAMGINNCGVNDNRWG
ncbi:hypothetical protein [Campylobacter majalis]|uniref:hypothetical protein n=1 Tax=Campylobacter majalis TaxID=2790656 RepID=UPI001E60E9DA|nr:hypothetical protein [Campylobacter majalis]